MSTGVKVSLVTHKRGAMVQARSFPGNPCDGHVLSAQFEQTANLLQDAGRVPAPASKLRGGDALLQSAWPANALPTLGWRN